MLFSNPKQQTKQPQLCIPHLRQLEAMQCYHLTQTLLLVNRKES